MRAKRLCVGMILSALVALASFISLAQPVAPLGIIIQPPDASDLSVRIWVDRGAYTVGEKIKVHFEVNEDAYVYIYDFDPEGKVTPLFPNAWSQNSRVSAGEHTLPDSAAYQFTVAGPPGTEYIQAIASTQPLSIPSQFHSTTPFAPLGLDPESFKSQYQARVLGIVPEHAWAQDWTSFEVVSGSAPSYGTVIVNSVPSGAWIALDGEFVGYTPRTLYVSVPPNYREVVVSMNGYRDWRSWVYVIAGRTRTINALLELAMPVNQPPAASFTATPGFSTWVHFDASASSDPDGSIVSYSWDFGDGKNGSGVSDWHWYSGPGTYRVTLSVTDDDGATDTEVRTIQVGLTNQLPVASFTFDPANPVVGGWVKFDATSSYDTDGSIATYAWNFGDGKSGSGSTDWDRYTAAGVYTVTLTVTDDGGATDTEVRTIQVGPTNQPPVASFTVSPPSPGIGEWVRFDASASYDPDGSIVSYSWDFGDRSSGAGVSEWHQYTAPGTYTVTLTVTDDDGGMDTEVRTIQVGPTNQPPVASFTVSPPNPAVGAQVLFNANTSYDPDGVIVSYRWNFGDGSISSPSATSGGYHSFATVGTYTVTLTVTDDDGATDTETQIVSVQAGPVSPTTGLVGYWRFNEGSGTTATDSSGYRNHGTIHGASWVGGSPDGSTALSFDGNDFVEVPNNSSLYCSRITIEAWIRPAAIYTGGDWKRDGIIVGTGDYYLRIDQNGRLGGWLSGLDVGEHLLGSSMLGYAGTWVHVAMTYDGTQVILYINGVRDASRADSGSTSASEDSLRIGHISRNRYFNGTIDEVRIHNRALDPSEFNLISAGVPVGQPPVAAFTYSPLSPALGEQIVLNAATSYDPDGMIVSYLWDLDGDGSDDTSGQIAAVRYYSLGVYPIRLTVTDNSGLSSVATQWITVGGTPGVPGGPAMGGTPGIFVWGTDTWHVTVNAGSTWASSHSYRLELRTDGTFRNVNQSTSGGVAPLGIVPTPTESGRTLLFEGTLQSGSLDYTFSVSNSQSIWMSLKLDTDGNGSLDESASFVYLRNAMVRPPTAPFVVGLQKGSSGPLVPSMNFRIGRALKYTSAVRFVMWFTDIVTLGG